MRCQIACGLVTLLTLLAEPSSAAEFPRIAFLSMGFEEVRVSDIRSTPEYQRRADSPSAYLSVTADFNGDGNPDEARILQNRSRDVAYIVAVMTSGEQVDTYVLSEVPLSDVRHIGIRALKPRPELTPGRVASGIAIFDVRTNKGEANYFDGEEFNVRLPLDGLEGPRS
jgi:hypothetical protein